MELQDQITHLQAAHPWLGVVWLGIVVLSIVSFFSVIAWLRRQPARTMAGLAQVPVLKIPDSDALGLLFVLSWLMIWPSGAYFFPAVSIGGVIWIARRHGIDLRTQWGSGRMKWWQVMVLVPWFYLAVMGALIPVSLTMEALASRFHWDPAPQLAVEFILKAKNPWQLGWLLFLALLLAPMSEEILFRGFLHPVLKKHVSVTVAWIVTAAIFGAIHFHAMTFPQLFLLGLTLGAIYEITGSLALCIGLHLFFNAATAGTLLLIKWL